MKANVLVVEDEAIIGINIKSVLEQMGHHVIKLVPTGEEAIQEAERHQLDLVLMDIVLKGNIDGIDTARKITEICDAPIIFITAFSSEDKLERAELLRSAGYLIKPVRTEELQASVEMALFQLQEKRKQQKQLTEENKQRSSEYAEKRDEERINELNISNERLSGILNVTENTVLPSLMSMKEMSEFLSNRSKELQLPRDVEEKLESMKQSCQHLSEVMNVFIGK